MSDMPVWERVYRRHFFELKGMVDQADNMHRECAFWRDQYQRVAYQLEKETEDG